MLQYIRNVVEHRRDDEGAAAVEYGLLVAAIAAIIVLLVFALGGYVKGALKDTCDSLKAAPIAKTGTSADCNS
jgi:pilus assembly protein Flp/PilA